MFSTAQEEITPEQDYKVGDLLSIQSTDGEITKGLVIGFDPSATMYYRRGGGGGSKSRGPMSNHWHIMLQEPETEQWLPAAVYDYSGHLTAHIHREHASRELQNEFNPDNPRYLAFSTEELAERVGSIVSKTSAVVKVDPTTQ